jgi:hypothetical protein
MQNEQKADKLVLTRLVAAHLTAHGNLPNSADFELLVGMTNQISEVSGMEPEMKAVLDAAENLILASTMPPAVEAKTEN